jgi:hypothetical protein
MTEAQIREFVRHFRENGLKEQLRHPANVRELLALTGTDLLDQIDFAHLTVEPTSYVASDYRHLCSDLVLRAPFRRRGGRRGSRAVLLYILIEHQSEPDALMLLRVLDYLVQIWKGQHRAWARRHRPGARFRLQPILPVVFYTGTGRWDGLGRLVDLVEFGDVFRDVTPDYRPLFVSLPALPAAALESAGGPFAWVLELLQQRRARPEEFRRLLRRVADHLEAMPGAQRERWLGLLSYVHALVYHDREESEHQALTEVILASVAKDERRREVRDMGRTIAEALEEKGRQKGREQGLKEGAVKALREALLQALRERYPRVPKSIERTIAATEDVERLNSWIVRCTTADTIEEIGIEG